MSDMLEDLFGDLEGQVEAMAEDAPSFREIDYTQSAGDSQVSQGEAQDTAMELDTQVMAPTAEQLAAEAAADEAAISRMLNGMNNPQEGEDSTKGLISTGPIDQTGKDSDAEDFEDISDDDLPEETFSNVKQGESYTPGLAQDFDMADMEGVEAEADGFDDLFGEDQPSSPVGGNDNHELLQTNGVTHNDSGLPMPSIEAEVDLRELNFPEHEHETNQDPSIPSAPEDLDGFIKQSWPGFEKGAILNFNQLLPGKKAHFIPKAPVKPPKAVNPTKVSLDLAPDSEKAYRAPGTATTHKRKRVTEAAARGIVAIIEESSDEEESEDEFDYRPLNREEDRVNGFSLQDLATICYDFDSCLKPQAVDIDVPAAETEVAEMDEWDREFLGHSSTQPKKRAAAVDDFVYKPQIPIPNFDNFVAMTAQVGKRVVLDMNDPYLLLEVQEHAPTSKRRRLGSNKYQKGNGSFTSALSARFNISNDEAYDALKENHQSKVRATLGNLTVEHSLPALKLQWPYYRVKLSVQSARSFHRPCLRILNVGQNIQFTKPGMRKRKALKGLSTQDIFRETKDLSLGEHYSNATLLEYSEEHPTVLSNFGMGNRIINYYRRKDGEDNERPQPEDKIGDTTVLLPEDRSPFANFGMVDPGETVRTLHNAMYRAPIFKHQPKSTDFLVIRNHTGLGGSEWHIRNIDNIFAVGQQMPSMEVPGPHSRKVTNAAKNRMKMIAYRKIRKSPHRHLKIGEITAHIPDSTDMQNRQKLKEFISYDKTEKVWRMREKETPPEETAIRSMVKPEEVCLIDAMQVGSRHLEDAGIAVQDDDDNVDDEGQSLEQNLAPWKTTKAFLEASADKAMLQLHGAGDPSGCGLALSFIKTSMKGGYLEGIQEGPVATSAARMAIDRKANNGHGYNVKTQQNLYNDHIRQIWEKQKNNLSDPAENEENDVEREAEEEERRLANSAPTPHSMVTPAPHFDDSASQYSTVSRQDKGKAMRITRNVRTRNGGTEQVTELVTDPKIWRQYEKRRREIQVAGLNVYDLKPTEDPEMDRQKMLQVQTELQRLQRNKDRRLAREKQKKGISGRATTNGDAASPSSTPAPTVEKQGTSRKCANCGQAGHIKTNKKLCPMLNGTMKQEDIAPAMGGFGAVAPPSFS